MAEYLDVEPTREPSSGEKLGFGVLLVYLFLVFSRVTEPMSGVIGNLHLVFLFGLLALILSVLTGGLMRGVRSVEGVCLAAYTGWLVVSTLTSFWRGGSFALLTETWWKSLLAFYVVAGCIASLEHCKRAMWAIAAGLIVIELMRLSMGVQIDGRLGLGGSASLENANALAFHSVVSLPFALLLCMQARLVWKVVGVLALAVGAMIVFQTGSRSGLLEVMVLMVVFFLHLPAPRKIMLAIAVVLLVAVGAPILSGLVPQSALDRYKTLIFTSPNDESDEYRSAVESTAARTLNFRESLRVTWENPIFGVGPGVYAPALADEFQRQGRQSLWRATHNAYTQVSSETGLPGFFLYMSALAVSLKRTFAVYRAHRHRPETKQVADVSLCLLLSLIAFAVNGVFDSNAYLFYFPVLAGLAVALRSSVTQIVPQSVDERFSARASQSRPARPWASSFQPTISPDGSPRPRNAP